MGHSNFYLHPLLKDFIFHPLRKVNFWPPKKRRSKCQHTSPSEFINRSKVQTQLPLQKWPSKTPPLPLRNSSPSTGGEGVAEKKTEWPHTWSRLLGLKMGYMYLYFLCCLINIHIYVSVKSKLSVCQCLSVWLGVCPKLTCTPHLMNDFWPCNWVEFTEQYTLQLFVLVHDVSFYSIAFQHRKKYSKDGHCCTWQKKQCRPKSAPC